MAEPSYKQRVERMVFASNHAHSRSRAVHQIKNAPKKAARKAR